MIQYTVREIKSFNEKCTEKRQFIYENDVTEKSLTYFCPEQILRGAKIRKSFSLDGLSFLFY